MTVHISEMWDGRTCEKNLDKFHRTYKRKFRLTGYATSADINSVLATGGLPTIGTSTYPSDAGALCVGASVQCGNGNYDITYSYDSQPPKETEENPLSRAPVVSGSFVKSKKTVAEDLDGVPILNTAGETFEQPPEIDISYPTMVVKKNYDPGSFDLVTLADFQNTCNDASWNLPVVGTTFAAYSVRLDSTSWDYKTENGINYIEVTWNFAANSDLWYPAKVLSIGFSEIFDGEKWVIMDSRGAQVQKPQLLDSTGAHTLDEGPPEVVVTTPYFIDFKLVEPMDWSSIP